MSDEIKVTYDGEYPCMCSGRLVVKRGDETLFDEDYCCRSTGGVSFDENWTESVHGGELVWEEAGNFPEDVQAAVKAKLSEFRVCCGGCV